MPRCRLQMTCHIKLVASVLVTWRPAQHERVRSTPAQDSVDSVDFASLAPPHHACLMVYPQAAQLLRDYFQTTNWYLDNHYSSLTLPSRNLLDFPIPPGLHLALSHRPTPQFASSLSLSALVPSHPLTYPPTPAPVLGPPPSPLLAGQLTYVFSTAPLRRTSTKGTAHGADRLKLEDVVQSFAVGALPIRPVLREGAQPTWLAGERVDKQGEPRLTRKDASELTVLADYLLYGRLYAPSPRLDALYVHRLSPTLQSLVSVISVPSPLSIAALAWPSDDPAPTSSSPSGTAARLSELEVKLQQDTGRWSSEYSYAFGDGMWGARGLYNFGKAGSGEGSERVESRSERRERVVDEEEEMSTGLKGRWSAGGEVYFSAQERSAGVSTGVRFSTLPEPNAAGPSQPPTTITATLNPIMGQLSTAYSVAVSPDSALGSRFDFNLFSYDADLTVGGEWFQRRKKVVEDTTAVVVPKANWDAFGRELLEEVAVAHSAEDTRMEAGEVVGVLKFRASTNTVRPLIFSPQCVTGLTSSLCRTSHYYGKDGWETSSSRSASSPTFVWRAAVGDA